MQVLVRRDSHKQEYRVRVAIADLRLQANIGESLTQLLKLRNSLCLICNSISPQSTLNYIHRLTRLRKAIANHIIDIQIALECLGFCHYSRWARIVEQRVFEVIDLGGETSEARNTGWALWEQPLGFVRHSKKLRWWFGLGIDVSLVPDAGERLARLCHPCCESRRHR
jgi:hypothetical protein